MTTEDFYRLKREQIANKNPFRIVDLAQIKKVDKDVLSINGMEIKASKTATQVLDEMIGFKKKQGRSIEKAYGTSNMHFFWNYLATAESLTKETKVALVADPKKKVVCDAIVLQQEAIMAEQFFDIAELVMDAGNLSPASYEKSNDGAGLILKMQSNNPIYQNLTHSLLKDEVGEEFITNNYYMKWSLGNVELGRYLERVVCSNGQIVTEEDSISRIYSTNNVAVNALIGTLALSKGADPVFERFKAKALTAMECRASMAEMFIMKEKLQQLRLEKDQISIINPYYEEMKMYSDRGYNLDTVEKKRLAMSSLKVWELYNNLTEFATHTPLWKETDHRRSILQMEATRFLHRRRDIRRYADIF